MFLALDPDAEPDGFPYRAIAFGSDETGPLPADSRPVHDWADEHFQMMPLAERLGEDVAHALRSPPAPQPPLLVVRGTLMGGRNGGLDDDYDEWFEPDGADPIRSLGFGPDLLPTCENCGRASAEPPSDGQCGLCGARVVPERDLPKDGLDNRPDLVAAAVAVAFVVRHHPACGPELAHGPIPCSCGAARDAAKAALDAARRWKRDNLCSCCGHDLTPGGNCPTPGACGGGCYHAHDPEDPPFEPLLPDDEAGA